jgi:hypothetical protein
MGLVLGLLLALALATGACGGAGKGSGVASLGGAGNATSTTNAGGGDQQKALNWARCMRQHGINMPDPKIDANGHTTWEFPRGSARTTPVQGGAAGLQEPWRRRARPFSSWVRVP